MEDNTGNQNSKAEVRRQTAAAISKESAGIPYRLPGMIAVAPGYLTYRLTVGHMSKNAATVVALIVFFGMQLLIGLYLRSFLRKHPDLKWQLLIH